MPGEKALYAALVADAAVVALVAQRVYPVSEIPVDAPMPHLAYGLISAVRPTGSGGNFGLVASRFQIDCVAATYKGAKQLAAAVINRMERFAGFIGTEQVQDTFVENEIDHAAFETNQRWVSVDIVMHIDL